MKLSSIVYAVAALALAGTAHAQSNYASQAEAQAMVKKAMAHFKTAGKDKALADFTQKGGTFIDRDLYVFVSDFTGKILAHGANDKLIGRDVHQLKDADGKVFVSAMIDQAKTGKGGWTDYKWMHPQTKEIEAKTTYCEPLEASMMVCVGAYK